jgi:hypothetical protein
MRWRLIAIAGSVVAAGVLIGVVFAQFTGTQTSSGTVNSTTDSPDLYLCEPEDEGVGCGPDDSGADEIIFEGLEDLLPSSVASSHLRLRNIGTNPLDVTSAVPEVTEVDDPGNDCDLMPDVLIRVLGKLPYVTSVYQQVNDNHGIEFANEWDLQIFPRAVGDPQYAQLPGYGTAVHIADTDYEDFSVEVMLPTTTPDACEDNVWDITINWNVVSVGHGPHGP